MEECRGGAADRPRCFAAVAVVDLVAEFAGWQPGPDLPGPADASLIWLCWTGAARRNRLVILVVIALGFCWLGDLGGTTVLLKIGFFLIAQVVYIVAFRPYWRGA